MSTRPRERDINTETVPKRHRPSVPKEDRIWRKKRHEKFFIWILLIASSRNQTQTAVSKKSNVWAPVSEKFEKRFGFRQRHHWDSLPSFPGSASIHAGPSLRETRLLGGLHRPRMSPLQFKLSLARILIKGQATSGSRAHPLEWEWGPFHVVQPHRPK